MTIRPIHKNDVRRVWPAVHSWIAESCAKVGENAFGLFRSLMNDPAFFLVIFEEDGQEVGAAVFQVDCESVHGVAIAGDLPEDWRETVDGFMERLARSLGVKMLTLEGRPGWQRHIKNLGWRLDAGRMVREV